MTEHEHHEAKVSLQSCRSAALFKSVLDHGPSEDQDVWKNQDNCHSQFRQTLIRSEIFTAEVKSERTFTERKKIST